MTPGMKIKIGRIQLRKKQYEFAKEVGISREYLRVLESDEASNPTVNLMKKIAEALGTTVTELFFEDESKGGSHD
jgi:putative transcriptional regulator